MGRAPRRHELDCGVQAQRLQKGADQAIGSDQADHLSLAGESVHDARERGGTAEIDAAELR